MGKIDIFRNGYVTFPKSLRERYGTVTENIDFAELCNAPVMFRNAPLHNTP